MASTLLITFSALAVLYFLNISRNFATNIVAARKSGIPYVVVPWKRYNILWLLTGDRLYPYLDKLPRSWTQNWLPFLKLEWVYEAKYEPFKRMGSDVIFVCSPSGKHLYVVNPEAIIDITTRRLDFPKPLEVYKTLQLYGENVVVTEGQHWRRHRKVTTPSFSEKNNRVVWDESLQQAQAILTHWTRGRASSPTLHEMDADMMSLSLHIISKAGFGVRCLWPHEEAVGVDGQDERLTSSKPPPGHTMSYKEAMSKLMKNVIWIPMLPKWLRDVLPFEGPRTASVAYEEWGMYMKELYEMKKTHIREGQTTEGLDLLGSVMRGAGITEKTLSGSEPQNQQLSDSEILGNAFIFILAGHETTANAMHFALALLALNPHSQRRLQQDISDMVGDRPVSQWDYDQDLQRLMNGMPAAVIYETLRMIPAVVGIPKKTQKDSPQALTVDGRNYVIPADTYIDIDTPGAHNHPKYWPARPDISALPSGEELEQFKPERWLVDEHNQPLVSGDGVASGKAPSPQLFKPAPGAFVPFSEGHRSCMGRRFAQVESISIIAALMHTHSVELAVDAFADDEQVAAMPRGGPERQEVWQKAANQAVDVIRNGLGTIITLQMRKGHVPLRIVKRGEERFSFDEQRW
ncbi:Cytochrome P450 [Macrophomina phaseolina MS6]|uniref:Cytochrome P450 n=1 Tax=Macrophomina phaseolina (strain MS6) TaxID=1126212 RepID=K2R5I5_MACPH|nr:Cytochrome P450 [Macrophomina phaseolina MS6]